MDHLLTAYYAANSGDIINLSQGDISFSPSSSVTSSNGRTAAIAIEKAVTINCLDFDNLCRLDGRGDKTVVLVDSGLGLTSLEGMSITRGKGLVSIVVCSLLSFV